MAYGAEIPPSVPSPSPRCSSRQMMSESFGLVSCRQAARRKLGRRRFRPAVLVDVSYLSGHASGRTQKISPWSVRRRCTKCSNSAHLSALRDSDIINLLDGDGDGEKFTLFFSPSPSPNQTWNGNVRRRKSAASSRTEMSEILILKVAV